MSDNLNPNNGAGADPNPGATAGTFDSEAFFTRFMGEVDKRINAIDKRFNKLSDEVKTFKPAASADTNAHQNGNTDSGGDDNGGADKAPKTVAELAAMLKLATKRIESVENENEKVKKERDTERANNLESQRVSAFDNAIADIPFANAKARTQFRNAYLPQVVRDEDGNYVANTDQGPMDYKLFLKTEVETSPHFLAPTGSGGAGATNGKKPYGAQKFDPATMSDEDLFKLTPEQKSSYLAALRG